MEELLALLALLAQEGIGGRQIRKLREAWGSLEVLWSYQDTAPLPSPLRGQVSHLAALRKSAEATLRRCETLGIQLIPYYSQAFPPLLEAASPPPALLFKKGPHPLIGQPLVAVVGTRKPTAYGLRVTDYFVEKLVEAGVGIVSGLAYGIDAQAHRATLEKGGKTIAVLAHGLERIYPPAHRSLAEAILEGGAWLSEYPPGVKLHPLHFPYRNRVIAGLAHLTLVIESRQRGGALFTARAAFAMNRPVFAVPGDIFSPASEGTHNLIAEQVAQIAYEPRLLLEELRWQTQQLPLSASPPPPVEQPKPSDPLHAQIYALLEKGLRHVDELCAAMGRSISEISWALMQMEIEGWIAQKPGGVIFRVGPPNAIS
ncbi:MAG: DNA-processing protein DprA [Bacteroidia bacterium]|nr:DNA-processing protein DprA [Bacteroidia bacterium]